MRHAVVRHGSCPTPDDDGFADYFSMAEMRADAKRGSRLLMRAILKAQQAPRPKQKPGPKHSYGTHEDRQLARAQIERLQRAVADHFGVSMGIMTMRRRGPREIAEKRQVAMLLAREIVQASYPDIGKCFGGKDHTTVIHACQVARANPELAADIAALRERFGA